MIFHAWTGLAIIPVLCLTLLMVSIIPRHPLRGRPDDPTQTSSSSNIHRSPIFDDEIEGLIDRLRKSSTATEEESLARQHFIQKRYPWMIRHRFQPNYLTNGHRVRSRSNPSGDLIRDHYVDAVKVLVHVPRTSATSLAECIGRLRNSSLLMAPQKVTEGHRRLSNKYDVHVGGAAFGICDELDGRRPCSYFTIFREPFRQAVSSYRHCRSALGDPQCNVVNANRVDLKSWILLTGGQLFRKFLFNGQICDQSLEDIAGNSTDTSGIMSSGRQSCWFKHKVWASEIDEDEKRILLDYVLENLERYFAVVGLYEDMDVTLRTLEFVYGLPFSECLAAVKSISPPRESLVNSSGRCRFSLEPRQEDELRNDVEVRKALQEDLRIYQRAREIVSHQNRRLFNRLKLLT